jgi:uncharacterized protein (DUF302 family)
MASSPDNGLIHLSSRYPVSETLERLETVLHAHQQIIFARVDHSGEANQAGLDMRPTKLIIFGNPVGGTPLMVAAPTLAIDLPLKALVWEDADGKVWLSYNRPDYLQRRHKVPDDLLKNIAGVGALLEQVVE